MATDIVLWVEALREDRWEFCHRWWVDRAKTPSGMIERVRWDAPYDERNYAVFALLANVRNPSGLVTPLVPAPRGMPSGLSDVGLRIVAEWSLGGLSGASWVGADELLSHDWDTACRNVVVADEPEMTECRRTEPACTVEPIPNAPGVFWVTLTRPERYWCGDFVEHFLPTLASYASPDRVRVCFFFFP